MALKVGSLLLVAVVFLLGQAKAVRFVLNREECFHETVEYDGDLVHVSFVIEGPNNFRQEVFDKAAEKLEFLASHRGSYKICLKNKSPYAEMIDFTVHVGHVPYYDQKVQDDHINPLMGQIAKLEEAIYAVQFEQHWLYAQTEQQSILNDSLSRRLIYRALFEGAALIGASVLQVYLLRRLFNKKLNQSRV
ncbi:hypothetical protein L7F22_061226 [Adiantum nelumboides]|nr:hypothetical protein [Adiantum nelumboides]